MTDSEEEMDKLYEPSPRPWWWKVPAWLPGVEAKRLEHLDKENLKQREKITRHLLQLETALIEHGGSEGQRNDMQRRIKKTERFRDATLDMERTIATRRQTLLLATAARATWAAVIVAGAPLAWELLKWARAR